MKEFDYYIFIDYSENLVGYLIVENNKISKLLPKLSKFTHFKELKHKSSYIHSIKRVIETKNILSDLFRLKLREMRQNLEIYSDVLNFIKKHSNCIIFISIDNHEFSNFKKLVAITNSEKTKVIEESKLKKGTNEYKLSLLLDTLLNIERLKNIG